MSDELKPCPFCGKPARASNELSREMFAACDNPECLTFGWGMPETLWQSRPIEDTLRAELDHMRRVAQKNIQFGIDTENDYLKLEAELAQARQERDEARQRVAELSAENLQLRAQLEKARLTGIPPQPQEQP